MYQLSIFVPTNPLDLSTWENRCVKTNLTIQFNALNAKNTRRFD